MSGYINAMRRYFEFGGRTSRAQFWLFILFYIIIMIIAVIIDSFVLGWQEGQGIPILIMIVALVHLIPSLSAGVRRLHDTDRSGWWWFINFVPLIGPIWLIVLYCLAGTPGPNRFGPPDA
jgi:uncharacterized membrane protein YhaH (DUF805 family)